MVKYKRLKSILNKGQHRILADLYKWAEETLEGPDLIEFQQDMEEFTTYYNSKQVSGDLEIEHIYSDIAQQQAYEQFINTFFGNTDSGDPIFDYYNGNNVQVGIYYTIPENFVRHEKELKWLDRMSKDLNVSFRNDEVVG